MEEPTREVFHHTTFDGIEFTVCVDGLVIITNTRTYCPDVAAMKSLSQRLNAWLVFVHTHLHLGRKIGIPGREFVTPHETGPSCA